jgi:hypothetical protein
MVAVRAHSGSATKAWKYRNSLTKSRPTLSVCRADGFCEKSGEIASPKLLQLTVEEVCGGLIGFHPIAMQQKIVDLIRKHNLLQGHTLLA